MLATGLGAAEDQQDVTGDFEGVEKQKAVDGNNGSKCWNVGQTKDQHENQGASAVC